MVSLLADQLAGGYSTTIVPGCYHIIRTDSNRSMVWYNYGRRMPTLFCAPSLVLLLMSKREEKACCSHSQIGFCSHIKLRSNLLTKRARTLSLHTCLPLQLIFQSDVFLSFLEKAIWTEQNCNRLAAHHYYYSVRIASLINCRIQWRQFLKGHHHSKRICRILQ